MYKKITLVSSVIAIFGVVSTLFSNSTDTIAQYSYGNQSPNINQLQNSSIIYNNQKIINQYNTDKKGFYLKNTILLPKPSLKVMDNKYSICTVENGSKIQLLKEVTNIATWIKVKILDGTCQGKIGWTGKENLIKR